MNREALLCDETESYRRPSEARTGEKVHFSFRTAKDDVDEVIFVVWKDGEVFSERRMVKTESDAYFDYYEHAAVTGDEVLYYTFRVREDDDICEYNRMGVTKEPLKAPFKLTPGFSVPQWCRGAVMYQIFTDRFCNGDPTNDVVDGEYLYLHRKVEKAASWDMLPQAFDVQRFYGGDLAGILTKLDYLKELGGEVIYLNPIFVSPSNHKYDCQDYEYVDPHLALIPRDADGLVPDGARDNRNAEKYIARTADIENLEASNRYFAEFIEKAHAKGIRVIIDGVFNHCGSFNRWMDREHIYDRHGGYPNGAYLAGDSMYRSFFRFSDPDGWPENDSYEGWWDQPTLPKLNYEGSESLYKYILEIARKWVSPPFCADGWRLDVAADLGHSPEMNHQFWRDFRDAVKSANPDAVLIAEHYGDPSSWLQGDQWDSVMNYDAFMEPVSWFLTGMEKHSDACRQELKGDGRAFFDAMWYHMSRMQTASVECAMNQLSNHDHSRFMTRTNGKVGRLYTAGSEAAADGIRPGIFRQGLVMQMTWPGAPTYYYGDETGMCGWTDPDNRRTYPWGHEDLEMIEFCNITARLRKRIPALRSGSVIELLAADGVIAYGRMIRGAGGSGAVVVVNTCEEARTVLVPVWKQGVTEKDWLNRVMLTYEHGYNVGQLKVRVDDGIAALNLPPVSSMILEVQKADEEEFSSTVLSGAWVATHRLK